MTTIPVEATKLRRDFIFVDIYGLIRYNIAVWGI